MSPFGVRVLPGPRLLAGASDDPTLERHRGLWNVPPRLDAAALLALLDRVELRGRGGAGFPAARKLRTAIESGRRRRLVVNAAEGEPGSAKDGVLLRTTPHLVLDGAETVAHALRVRTVHVVVPGERPEVEVALRAAVAERGRRFRYRVHRTSSWFVGGQARAVIELVEGRRNLPVTAWAPEAVSGLDGRPTLLSNAETFAQLAALVALGPRAYTGLGTVEEPGTRLLTLCGDSSRAAVAEVPHGVPLREVLALVGLEPGPVLLGGYHGVWLDTADVARRRLLTADLAEVGASIGAGVLLPLPAGECPVIRTAAIVGYLAGQSAGRCGPCRHGLPALAGASSRLASTGLGTPVQRTARGPGVAGAADRMAELAGLVTGRGACAHPDGTARLVRSLLTAFPQEVAAHENGRCGVQPALSRTPESVGWTS